MKFLKFSKYSIKIITLFFLWTFLGNIACIYAQRKYKVVLDAGHGGKDPGNLGSGYKESAIALKVVLLVGKSLNKNNKDIEVIYTRRGDDFVELHNRAKIANNSKADLFISVHCDSYKSSKAHGAGTFVLGLSGNKENLEIAKRENAVILLEDNYEQNYDYNPNSPESVISMSMLQEENLDESLAFAELVQNNFSAAKRYNRSVKQNNFLVLRETVMPSVLIELGFLTNKTEGGFLNSKSGQMRMAKSIVQAIEKHINQLKLNTIKPRGVVVTSISKKPEKTSRVDNLTKDSKEISEKTEKVLVKKKITPEKTKFTAQNTVVKKGVKESEKPGISVKSKMVTTPSATSPIEFKVQIAASKKYLTNQNFNFKGLEDVEVLVVDQYYKYYYGSTRSYTKVKKNLITAKKAGHEGCFVVAFENGKKIPLWQALRK